MLAQVSEGKYAALVERENVNRQEDVVEATSVEQAVHALASVGISTPTPEDKHPEKCVRLLGELKWQGWALAAMHARCCLVAVAGVACAGRCACIACADAMVCCAVCRRMRAAWLAFEEHNLPLLKMEKPGLKQSQYRDLLWTKWQRSPDNPINQAKAAAK